MKVQRQPVANEGRLCITHPQHGPSLILHGSKREYCPHHEHDGIGKGKARSKPTTPFLDKQVIEDDTADRPQSA
jgi:hypothetical protein